MHIQLTEGNCWGMDHSTARRKPASPLRSRHRCRLAVSAQFPRSLVRKSEKSASKRFRYDASGDATAALKSVSNLAW